LELFLLQGMSTAAIMSSLGYLRPQTNPAPGCKGNNLQ
jgi:hypothetical protein